MSLTAEAREQLLQELQFTFLMDAVATHLSELICGVGIIANMLLIYVILTKTPIHMRTYAVLLFNFSVFDLLTCIASLFACQKTIFSGISLTYIFHGPCKYVGDWLCYFCHCFVCHAMAHSQWILLISFFYRYRILMDDHTTVVRMAFVTVAFYSMSFVTFLFYYLDRGNEQELMGIMCSLHPTYHYNDTSIWGELVVSGNTTIITVPSLVAIIYMTMTCVPIYVAVHYLRSKTLSTLTDSSLNMSPATKASHQKLVKALTIQAAIPLFWLLASGVFTLAEFGVISGPIPENMTFRLMDCIPVCSPIAAFVFIAPYRNGLFSLLTKVGLMKPKEEIKNVSQIDKPGAKVAPSAMSNKMDCI
ncbi:unnamed protein product [Caenorhabditis angaria]|uniref:G-protein coupled receptors family 1 profile domain-containing protein n=1 Tax=Caenorhabditis angaria TaxID=860376 RepID=A0A9P1MZC2_9PELO|nr:unnamed protein product [Caenorhabditis angaria]